MIWQQLTEAPVLVMGCINAWVLVGHDRARVVSGRWGFDLWRKPSDGGEVN